MRILVAETSWPTAAGSAELIRRNIGVIRASDGGGLPIMAEMALLNGIVFDSRMPGLTASSAVRQLRRFDPDAGIRVIDRSDARRSRAPSGPSAPTMS